MSWPNRITVLRLLLVPVFILLVLSAAESSTYRYAAMGLAALIGICDSADGILARRTGKVTPIGSILDPLADKALMVSALVILSIPGILSPEHSELCLPYWVSVPLVSRDLVILAGVVVLFLLTGVFQVTPSTSGKAATVMEFVTIVLTLGAPDLVGWFPTAAHYALLVVWGVTVALGVLSWLGYIRTGSKLLTASGQ